MGKAKAKGKTVDVVAMNSRLVIAERTIQNPMATDGTVEGEREAGKEAPGWMTGHVNLVTQIGGLARMKDLTEQDVAIARWWRDRSELALIGGARATDYSAIRVDVSPSGRDVALDGATARRELHIARRRIGPFRARTLDRLINEEMSLREFTAARGGKGGNGRLRTNSMIRDALDALNQHVTHGRRPLRREGDRHPAPWSTEGEGKDDEVD